LSKSGEFSDEGEFVEWKYFPYFNSKSFIGTALAPVFANQMPNPDARVVILVRKH
jgi:hypothetical protein